MRISSLIMLYCFQKISFYFFLGLLVAIITINHPILAQNNQNSKEISTSNPTPTDKKNSLTDKQNDFSTLLEKALTDTNIPKSDQEISWGWQIIKTTIALLCLIGIFFVIWKLYFFRQKTLRRESPNKSLQLISLHNKLLLLGISDSGGIQLISEISDKNSIDQIKLYCEQENAKEKADFLMELTKAIKNNVRNFTKKRPSAYQARFHNQDISYIRNQSKDKLNSFKQTRSTFNKPE